ncbi:MAG: CBS domain-containing protein [Candidatus Lokiarchaeota archaeon]|nr:CBS domain-containing protein [Candidatus Lokiarchaeota archaeon]
MIIMHNIFTSYIIEIIRTMLPDLAELKILRKKLNISQAELAKICGLNQSTISRIENQQVDPPYSTFKLLYSCLKNEERRKKESSEQIVKLMTRDIISIHPQTKLKDAITLMNKYNVSQLPILDKNQNIGSITSKKAQELIMENSDLLNIDISDVKELPFPEVDKNWNLKDVSDLLIKYPAVLIKEFDKYIGIMTDADVLKLP